MKDRKETVYIIDSGNDFRFVCKESLNNLGFHVVGDSGDGAEALVQIKTLQPEVVLLDLWFPGYDPASLIRVYGLFRDLAAPFGVAVFVPMFTNEITRLSADTTVNLSTSDVAVSSIHMLAIIELVCVTIGIFIVQLLPQIYKNNNLKGDQP